LSKIIQNEIVLLFSKKAVVFLLSFRMRQAWQNRYKQGDSEITSLDNLIQKDVRRTDRTVKFFEDKENLSRQKLFNILMTYSVYHPEPGYVQGKLFKLILDLYSYLSSGMNDMAAPILYVIRDEALAYACFCALMRYMSPLFHSNGIAMNRRLNLLRKTRLRLGYLDKRGKCASFL